MALRAATTCAWPYYAISYAIYYCTYYAICYATCGTDLLYGAITSYDLLCMKFNDTSRQFSFWSLPPQPPIP
eukprot:3923069-Rhodomonas_salina.1